MILYVSKIKKENIFLSRPHFVSCLILVPANLLEETPGQAWGETMEDARWQLEDGTEVGLQGGGTTSVDHNHLVDQVRIFVGQECAERHSVRRSVKMLATKMTWFEIKLSNHF